MGFRGVLGHEFVGVAESGPYAGPPGRRRDQLRLPAVRRPAAAGFRHALPEPHGPRHPESRRRVCRPHCRAAAQPALGARLAARRDRGLHRAGGRRVSDPGSDHRCAGRTASSCSATAVWGICVPRCWRGLSDRVLVVGKHPPKLALLAALGIATALLSDPDSTSASADIVVDCTGSETGLPTALQARAPAGHDRAEDHGRRHADAGVGAVRHRRGHAGRIAMRAVRSGARGARARGGQT